MRRPAMAVARPRRISQHRYDDFAHRHLMERDSWRPRTLTDATGRSASGGTWRFCGCRDFVVVLTSGGGGLLLGCRMGERSGTATAAAAPPPLAFAPNAFIRIGSDGRVTLIMNQVEMGQGTYTSMPMLLAEELEVGLDQVQLEHAPPNDKLYANPFFGDQETGGSSSVRGFYEPLRHAGATARTMLIAAAAQSCDA